MFRVIDFSFSFSWVHVLCVIPCMILTGCICSGNTEFENQSTEYSAKILIPGDSLNFKVYMTNNLLTDYIHSREGHSLQYRVQHTIGLGDTIILKATIKSYYYHEKNSDSLSMKPINVLDLGDTVEISPINEISDSTASSNDIEFLSRTCACSLIDPYSVIDSLVIEADTARYVNVFEGIISN